MRKASRVLFFCAALLSFVPLSVRAEEKAGDIDLVKARQYFTEFDRLCAKDGGKLWGKSLCGPLLLVDPGTRAIAANRADANGMLKPQAGVFVGRLPDDVGIANTAMQWGGTRWTMIMWGALDDDRVLRLTLMAHEAFHRVQPDLGLVPTGAMNAHLDTPDGRFWMKMEWNALQAALGAKGRARRRAIADALTFRAARRARFPEAAGREAPLEIFEGLAEYTGAALAGCSESQVVKSALGRRAADTGFVRSFAYVSGPLYGFLLDGTGVPWRSRITKESDLGSLLGASAKASSRRVGEAERLSERYGGPAVRIAERERAEKREARIAAWRASLIDGPVLIVDLNAVTSETFDPRRVFPLDDKRTVYTTRSLIGAWGTLTVEEGTILEDRTAMQGRVSLAGAAGDHTKGTGWSLKLEDGWTIVPGGRAGDLEVRKR